MPPWDSNELALQWSYCYDYFCTHYIISLRRHYNAQWRTAEVNSEGCSGAPVDKFGIRGMVAGAPLSLHPPARAETMGWRSGD